MLEANSKSLGQSGESIAGMTRPAALCDKACAGEVDPWWGDIIGGKRTGQYTQVEASVVGDEQPTIEHRFTLFPYRSKVRLVRYMFGLDTVDRNILWREIESWWFDEPTRFVNDSALFVDDHCELACAIGATVGRFEIDSDKIEHGATEQKVNGSDLT